MRWTRARTRQAVLGAGLLLCCTLLLCVPDRQLQLMVYTPQKTYAIEVLDRQGKLYISLADLLIPLGNAGVQLKQKEWKLTFNGSDAIFTEGSESARIRGKSVNLDGKVLTEDKRLLVPLSASYAVMSALLKVPVELHADARRLFIDNATTRFTAELKKSERPALLLNFDHPVNPIVTQEDSKLKLTFKSDPVISDITNQPWDDKSIQSLTFSEDNGVALMTIAGGPGLSASVAGDGRSIVIQPLPAPAAVASPPLGPEPSSPAAGTPAPQAGNQTHSVAFFVMIDPGHGGDDEGAHLGDRLAEKDVTLALARRIKAELQERGIAARLVRDADVSVSLEQRAETSNEQRAAAYVAIHAGIPGGGVRVYIPAFAANVPPASGKFLTWDNAQARYLPRSRALARGVAGELDRRNITVVTLGSPLRPLNNINAPAIAIELAADPDNAQDVAGQRFQTTVATAIAVGIAQLRAQLEAPE